MLSIVFWSYLVKSGGAIPIPLEYLIITMAEDLYML
jgi:hypothetical protein